MTRICTPGISFRDFTKLYCRMILLNILHKDTYLSYIQYKYFVTINNDKANPFARMGQKVTGLASASWTAVSY